MNSLVYSYYTDDLFFYLNHALEKKEWKKKHISFKTKLISLGVVVIQFGTLVFGVSIFVIVRPPLTNAIDTLGRVEAQVVCPILPAQRVAFEDFETPAIDSVETTEITEMETITFRGDQMHGLNPTRSLSQTERMPTLERRSFGIERVPVVQSSQKTKESSKSSFLCLKPTRDHSLRMKYNFPKKLAARCMVCITCGKGPEGVNKGSLKQSSFHLDTMLQEIKEISLDKRQFIDNGIDAPGLMTLKDLLLSTLDKNNECTDLKDFLRASHLITFRNRSNICSPKVQFTLYQLKPEELKTKDYWHSEKLKENFRQTYNEEVLAFKSLKIKDVGVTRIKDFAAKKGPDGKYGPAELVTVEFKKRPKKYKKQKEGKRIPDSCETILLNGVGNFINPDEVLDINANSAGLNKKTININKNT